MKDESTAEFLENMLGENELTCFFYYLFSRVFSFLILNFFYFFCLTRRGSSCNLVFFWVGGEGKG